MSTSRCSQKQEVAVQAGDHVGLLLGCRGGCKLEQASYETRESSRSLAVCLGDGTLAMLVAARVGRETVSSWACLHGAEVDCRWGCQAVGEPSRWREG